MVFLVSMLVFCMRQLLKSKGSPPKEVTVTQHEDEPTSPVGRAHVQLLDMLDGKFVKANNRCPKYVSTDIADVSYLLLHKDDSDSLAEGYFRGKKRLWELRVQITLKTSFPVSDIRLGVSPYQRQEFGRRQELLHRWLIGVVCTALDGLYNTPGDNPTGRASHDVELPQTSVPLCEVDQYIEHVAGQKPSLTDSNFPQLGRKKVTNPSAFRQNLSRRTFEAGETHTFAVWGPSFALDLASWSFASLPVFSGRTFDLGNGPPPVFLALYRLKPAVDGEKRHLESRKQTFMRIAGWSSSYPPLPVRMQEMLAVSGGKASLENRSLDDVALRPVRSGVTVAWASSLCCAEGLCRFLHR